MFDGSKRSDLKRKHIKIKIYPTIELTKKPSNKKVFSISSQYKLKIFSQTKAKLSLNFIFNFSNRL